MRAFISINQQAFSQLNGADLVDATIFEYIYKFAVSNQALKQIIDNKLYFWVSYQKIIDDNPLINISSKEVIARRIKKLINYGLLSKYIDKKQGNKTYFNITDFAYDFIINGENTYLLESRNLSTQKSKPLSTFESNNRELYNRELDSKEKNTKKEKITKEYNVTFNDKNNQIGYSNPPLKDELKETKNNDKDKNTNKSLTNFYKWLKEHSLIAYNKRNEFDSVFYYLRTLYSLETIIEVLEWGISNEFWQDKLLNAKSIKNNFDKMKMQMLKEKEKNKPNETGIVGFM